MMSSLSNHSFAATPTPALATTTALTRRSRVLSGLLWVTLALLLSACAVNAPAAPAATAQNDAFNGAIENVAGYVLPLPTPTVEPDLAVVVNTDGARANIRSGPGTDFPIIGKANAQSVLEVLARSEDNNWWQVCCFTTDANGNDISATENISETTGWVANSVVRAPGDDEAVAISRAVFNSDLEAEWQVDWKCGSERCEVKECKATVSAKVGEESSGQLLPIEHQVVWDDACFDSDEWVFEVNQFTGQEQTGEYKDNFLYSYWLGREPGQINGVYPLSSTEAVAVYCSGPHEVEIEEGDGWTTLYEGNTCHDVGTGMLVYLAYNKRWLYTGEYEGKNYERAYFGDFETLEQKLVDTTADLLLVQKRR